MIQIRLRGGPLDGKMQTLPCYPQRLLLVPVNPGEKADPGLVGRNTPIARAFDYVDETHAYDPATGEYRGGIRHHHRCIGLGKYGPEYKTRDEKIKPDTAREEGL